MQAGTIVQTMRQGRAQGGSARHFMASDARPTRQHAGEEPNAASSSAVVAGRLTPLRELQLLEAYRAGGSTAHTAMTELLAGYQRRIYGVCYRMVRRPEDAADLTQDVLLKLVENLSTYDGRSQLSTWIIRVAMNACLSHLRRQKTRRTLPLNDPAPSGADPGAALPQPRRTPPASREPSPLAGVELQQQRSLALEALGQLDADTKAILVLRDMQDMDYQQLAEVLDVPIGTVKSRLFRARAAFREAFEALGGEGHEDHSRNVG